MGIIIKKYGKFDIKDGAGEIELNLGNSYHIHIGGIKIAMSSNEFHQFAEAIIKAENQLEHNKRFLNE